MHAALLQFADELAAGPQGDREIRWRRAVSAAYYSVFHLLTFEATEQLRGVGQMDDGVRAMLARSFDHGPMKTASAEFTKQIQPSAPLARLTIPVELKAVASNFVKLQGMRHVADYDTGIVLDHLATQQAVRLARETFDAWSVVRGTEAGRVYLFLLLSRDGVTRQQQGGPWLPATAPTPSSTPPSPPAPPLSGPPEP